MARPAARQTSKRYDMQTQSGRRLSDSQRMPDQATTDAIIYGHCKFSFDNGGGYGGGILDNDGGADFDRHDGVPDPRRQYSFRSGTDLIAVISIFWHFWMAHKVTAAPRGFLPPVRYVVIISSSSAHIL